MIFDFFMDQALRVVKWIAAKIAAVVPDVPSWVSQGSAGIRTVMTYATSLGNWVPLTLFVVCVTAVVGCLVAGLLIKVIRIIASYVTLGGGSAG